MSPSPKKKKGGARPGSGRKKKEVTAQAAPPEKIDARGNAGHLRAAELIHALNSPPPPKGDTIEVAGWRRFWDSMNQAIAFDVRKWVYDKADGKAVQTINHVHEKPFEMNVNVTLRERYKRAMEKAEQRVAGRS